MWRTSSSTERVVSVRSLPRGTCSAPLTGATIANSYCPERYIRQAEAGARVSRSALESRSSWRRSSCRSVDRLPGRAPWEGTAAAAGGPRENQPGLQGRPAQAKSSKRRRSWSRYAWRVELDKDVLVGTGGGTSQTDGITAQFCELLHLREICFGDREEAPGGIRSLLLYPSQRGGQSLDTASNSSRTKVGELGGAPFRKSWRESSARIRLWPAAIQVLRRPRVEDCPRAMDRVDLVDRGLGPTEQMRIAAQLHS